MVVAALTPKNPLVLAKQIEKRKIPEAKCPYSASVFIKGIYLLFDKEVQSSFHSLLIIIIIIIDNFFQYTCAHSATNGAGKFMITSKVY